MVVKKLPLLVRSMVAMTTIGNNEEYHFNINTETGQYHCFKCNENGNLITLKKHFGDLQKKSTTQSVRNKNRMPTTMSKVAEVCHNNLPPEYRKYFQDRGITDENIGTPYVPMFTQTGSLITLYHNLLI